ncbi:MAG: SDR family oxidoreductase [Firmicutes bacterium]|uniref:SDR family oxidoreductase n=1 Tax=Candidatus Onthovivens merdipullorum TaxID=2840889 RepID=A0A9D9DIJ8_9BACL|nr:SDR family oxidoreductase [Candidatus Onthovivens merdipullorum]
MVSGKNKVVLISGVSSGFGLETAKLFIDNGYKVIGLSRKDFTYPNLDHYKCDITNEVMIKEVMTNILNKYKHIDILINNAGIGNFGPIEETSSETIKNVFNTNFFGAFLLTKEILPSMRENKGGRIINVSSIGAIIPLPFQAFYSASKASLDTLFCALASEVYKYNIKITSIKPGDAKTNFTKNRTKDLIDKNSSYYEAYIRSLKGVEKDETSGIPSIKIAKTIYKVSKKKHPPLSKNVGLKDSILSKIYKILPKKIGTYLLYKIYAS